MGLVDAGAAQHWNLDIHRACRQSRFAAPCMIRVVGAVNLSTGVGTATRRSALRIGPFNLFSNLDTQDFEPANLDIQISGKSDLSDSKFLSTWDIQVSANSDPPHSNPPMRDR
ncbi:MAG TPA: hypothetical protein VM555_10165 [Tahibacter sp.]|nr:hypothetical protein [Tahibacter sp.]